MSSRDELEYKKYLEAKRDLLLRKQKRERELPHLYGFKEYWWSRAFIESTKRMNFLTAANQMGKSISSVRKCVKWNTEPSLWPELWPGREPSLMFYLYPSIKLATREFKTKWIKEILPRGDMKNDPQYGWEAEYSNKEIHAVHFNSGTTLIFLSYAMSVDDLQASTPVAIFCDEEIPAKIYPELLMRLEASKGHFHLVCTPTKGQQIFRDIFERKTHLPDSLVITASLYDAVKYEDGSPGLYTLAEVKRREAILGSEKEIQLRIYGRFVKTEGLLVPGFDVDVNLKPGGDVPDSWEWYSAVDVGSGGSDNHPAAICFVAVEMGPKGARRGRIVRLWRGDNIETANSDILIKYIELRDNQKITRQFYDGASKDFSIHAERAGEFFERADKSKDFGYGLLNSLFKTGMLTLDEECEEGTKLINEIENLRTDTRKTHALDDLVDALRYTISRITWDLSNVTGPGALEAPKVEQKKKMYRGEEVELNLADDYENDIAELNELLGE